MSNVSDCIKVDADTPTPKQIKNFTGVKLPNLNKLINDGGTRVEFVGGATRESQIGKGRFDLITPEGLNRLAKWYELGAMKYAPRNWETGIPISNCVNSMFRHMVKYMDGMNDEDHLAAIAWNAFAIMHYETHNPDMQDIPNRLNLNATGGTQCSG